MIIRFTEQSAKQLYKYNYADSFKESNPHWFPSLIEYQNVVTENLNISTNLPDRLSYFIHNCIIAPLHHLSPNIPEATILRLNSQEENAGGKGRYSYNLNLSYFLIVISKFITNSKIYKALLKIFLKSLWEKKTFGVVSNKSNFYIAY